MRIQIIPATNQRASALVGTVRRVVMEHPLIDSVPISVCKSLKSMLVNIDTRDTALATSICFDLKSNTATLFFDPFIHNDNDERDKALCHEFTHVIDRLNPNFGIDCQSEGRARDIHPSEMTQGGFVLYQSVWNCYIDGRLEQFGKNPRNLDQHLQEFHEKARKIGGHFTPEVDRVLRCAWNSENLSFNEIICLVRKCLQHWQSKNRGETL